MPTRGAERSAEERGEVEEGAWREEEEKKKKNALKDFMSTAVQSCASARPACFISSVKCAGSQLSG